MNAIIVDDEPRAIELLKSYLEHFKSISLIGSFRNGLKALEFMADRQVDLLFLDINMPHISGVALAKILPEETRVIFTTAYSEFAVESYEIRAIDYLLKPISLERFTKSMSRILNSDIRTLNKDHKYVIVKSGFETFRIECSEILFLEKDGNYISYMKSGKKVIARETIHESMAKLPGNFIQIHKSFIVNIDKISRFDKNKVFVDGHQIPITDTYKNDFLKMMEA